MGHIFEYGCRTYMFYEWTANGQYKIAVYIIDFFKIWVRWEWVIQVMFWKKEVCNQQRLIHPSSLQEAALPFWDLLGIITLKTVNAGIQHWFQWSAFFHFETLVLSRAKPYGAVARQGIKISHRSLSLVDIAWIWFFSLLPHPSFSPTEICQAKQGNDLGKESSNERANLLTEPQEVLANVLVYQKCDITCHLHLPWDQIAFSLRQLCVCFFLHKYHKGVANS